MHPNGIELRIDKEVQNLFDKFLFDCKTNNTNVIVVYAPELKEMQNMEKNRGDFVKKVEEMTNQYNFTFLDYSEAPINYNQTYFQNSRHLNRKGASNFSKLLANDLQSLLK